MVKLNFAKQNMDSLSFSGTVPMGSGFAPASKQVSIIAGGYRKDLTFDAKGKSKLFTLTGKKGKDGKFTDATLKFTVKLSKVALVDYFADLGFDNATIKEAQRVENVTLLLVIGGNAFSDTVKFDYKATEEKSGTGKLVP